VNFTFTFTFTERTEVFFFSGVPSHAIETLCVVWREGKYLTERRAATLEAWNFLFNVVAVRNGTVQ
jgi:hypothetical protein